MEEVLRYWESIDGAPFTDEIRMECADAIASSTWTIPEWKAALVKIPDNLNDRYLRILNLLLDNKLITQSVVDAEKDEMRFYSPAKMVRVGKELSDWYRSACLR